MAIRAPPVGDPLTGHTNIVSAVAFGTLPGGRVLLASGSFFDGAVRLWDPAEPSANALRAYDVAPFKPLTLVFERTTIYLGGTEGLIALDLKKDVETIRRASSCL